MLGYQLLEHLFAGGILPGLGLFGLRVELETVEEPLAHLGRAADVERSPGEFIDLFLHLVETLLHIGLGAAQ